MEIAAEILCAGQAAWHFLCSLHRVCSACPSTCFSAKLDRGPSWAIDIFIPFSLVSKIHFFQCSCHPSSLFSYSAGYRRTPSNVVAITLKEAIATRGFIPGEVIKITGWIPAGGPGN